MYQVSPFPYTVNDLIKRPGRLLNFKGSGEMLNRYEAFIRGRRLFHFNCNNVNKLKQIRRKVARGVRDR